MGSVGNSAITEMHAKKPRVCVVAGTWKQVHYLQQRYDTRSEITMVNGARLTIINRYMIDVF